MNKDVGVSLKSTSNVNINASGALTLKGAAVSLSGTQGLSVKTASDTIEFLEENKSSSEEIKLEASNRNTFDHMPSAFEKELQGSSVAAIMAKRAFNNQVTEAKGKLDALGDTLLGLWYVVVDTGDIASTALPTSYLVDAIYEGVTGDTVTGNKSWEQIKSDAKSFGQGLYDDYIDPFVKDAQYDQDNLLKGGLWTRSEEQSYAKGQNEFKKDMVVAEVAVSALSAGTGTAVTRTVKMANKLDGLGGRKGLDGGGGKGIGGRSLDPIEELMDGGASIFDGKMKTSAKTPNDMQTEIQALVEKLHMQMKEQSNKEINDRLDGGMGHSRTDIQRMQAGTTGSRAPGKERVHAEKSLDVPNKNTLPKVVNGDSGHSNHSPSLK
ncbi:hypothetical protein [Paenibacillus ehimensis]|uniref:hypothetical protein n=1 Tax=Paenibacillus ehimensis TaxID=79264 RepID=UPI00047193E4|nr:hypothetical protein [Paenibacillus ehimensis]